MAAEIAAKFSCASRLRVGDIRVFYDLSGPTVEVLAIVAKWRPSRGSHSSEIRSEGGPALEIKDDLSRYLREAETQEIIITRHGKPAGVLIGFESEEDWFDYRLDA